MKGRSMRRLILVVILIAGAAAGAVYLPGMIGKETATARTRNYEFTTITRGSIEKTVSSSGTLQPVSTVKVLAQMSGRVEKVYADYNDRVVAGQVLVELNTDMLKLERETQLASVRKAQANYDLQLLDWQNKTRLAEKELVSAYDMKSSKTTLDVRSAELEAAENALEVIETKISQYAKIKSPIAGIVLEKAVEVGQSVVEGSSSNSSSLFTLAEDLSRMEIKATVDEMDIPSIKTGQKVRFTVEALPSVSLTGSVAEVRLVPSTSNNVVSYSVIIRTENTTGKLLPGMTAEVEFIEEEKTDVLLVSSAAFRFQPSTLTAQEIARKTFLAGLGSLTEAQRAEASARYDAEQQAMAAAAKSGAQTAGGLTSLVSGGGPVGGGAPPGGGPDGGFPGAPGGGSTAGAKARTAGAAGTVVKKTLWYVDDADGFQALLVETGVSDGSKTEILADASLEGRKILLREKVE